MKHKHYEMIVAKAANMDLVIMTRNSQGDGKWWALTSDQDIVPSFDQPEYFACLPQHKEACLHWMNGGEIQKKGFYNECEFGKIEIIGASKWHINHIFMDDSSEFRIKPKKENRWIGYCANTNQAFPHPQKSKEVAEDYAARNYGYKMSDWQFIEIEVEV